MFKLILISLLLINIIYAKTAMIVVGNTTIDTCPSSCTSDFPNNVCFSRIFCDSTIQSNSWNFAGSTYPYLQCVYKWHLIEPTTYTMTFCDDSSCEGATVTTIYYNGCNQNNGLNDYGCGVTQWVAAYHC